MGTTGTQCRPLLAAVAAAGVPTTRQCTSASACGSTRHEQRSTRQRLPVAAHSLGSHAGPVCFLLPHAFRCGSTPCGVGARSNLGDWDLMEIPNGSFCHSLLGALAQLCLVCGGPFTAWAPALAVAGSVACPSNGPTCTNSFHASMSCPVLTPGFPLFALSVMLVGI